MQFCTECGGTLNIFESNDDKICWNCAKKKEAPKPVPTVPAATDEDNLKDAELILKDNTLILKAKEGWVLWSGPADKRVNLGTILKRAQRIYGIRKKHNSTKE